MENAEFQGERKLATRLRQGYGAAGPAFAEASAVARGFHLRRRLRRDKKVYEFLDANGRR